MHGLLSDLIAATRLLRRHAGASLFAAGLLASGIGAATLVFSLVHAVLLRDLPFADPDRVVWMYNLRTERDRAPLSIPDFEDYGRDAQTLAGLAAFTNLTTNVTGGGTPERLEGIRVSGAFFSLLGIGVAAGRGLTLADERAEARVAVITYGLWQRRFGSDPGIVGRSLVLNDAPHTVVGVLPRGFLFPLRQAELAVPLPLASDARRAARGANFLRVVARLRPEVTREQARAEMNAIADRLRRQYPDENARKIGISLFPLHAEIVRDYRTILWTLMAAAAVFAAVGCGNLATLLLVRASGRRAEMALRFSLGASRARVARQLVIEAALLAAAGAAGGIILVERGLAVWPVLAPAEFPRLDAIEINRAVLSFAALVSAVAAIGCGLAPALAAGRQPATMLIDQTRQVTGGRRPALARRGFVLLQVAGSVILLVTMGLMAQGLGRLEAVDPGFTPDGALSVQLSLPAPRYGTRESIARFSDRLAAELSALPGVRSVGAVSLLPLSGLLSTADVAFPDRPAPPPDQVPQAHLRVASPGYFSAAGIRIIDGAEFSDRHTANGQLVAIVSRTFASRHWHGEAAVGRTVSLVQAGPPQPMAVVAVVDDVKQFGLDGDATADLYVPVAQMPAFQAPLVAARFSWVLRSDADPRLLAGSVRRAVEGIDGGVATSGVRTLGEVLDASLGGRRTGVRLLQGFGMAAVALAALGIYGVAVFSASARRRELAIRSAVGATRRALIVLMIRSELTPVLVGVVVGLGAAAAATRWLGDALFQTNPADPATFAAAGLATLAISALAMIAPARRSGRADPSMLLRS